MNEILQEKLRDAPKLPGCYCFVDREGRVLYVGKSKMLSNRVRSYFHAGAKEDERIRYLVPKIADVNYLVTPSETDALLQEYRLIKQHKPFFNSQMKRDPKRPFIRIDTASDYPSISIVNEISGDGAEYFGSFSDVFDARETIESLSCVYRTQLCMRAVLPAKACLYHALNKCVAPCAKGMDSAAYRSLVEEAADVLRGHYPGKLAQIEQEIEAHIQSLAFEKAAALHEKQLALEHLFRKCQKIFRLHDGQDAVVLLRAYRSPECILFCIRRGAVVGRAYISGDDSKAKQKRAALKCLRADPAAPTEAWLAQCVTEVFADKLFLRIPAHQPEAETVRAVMDQITSFIK